MGFISFKACSQSQTRPVRIARPRAVTFRPASCAGTQVGGLLTLRYEEGAARTLRVCMTWDALDRLRTELARNGVHPGDATILHRVLTCWGVEEYGRRLADGTLLPAEGLLLTLSGGPGTCEPRRLLFACGLMPPAAA